MRRPAIRRAFLLAGLTVAGCLTLASAASAALPPQGVLAPGAHLAGVRLGMTPAQVSARWGADFGRCRSCVQPTRYYTLAAFHPEGAAVVFERRRVVQVYTLWQPPGWRTREGLELGAPEGDVSRVYRGLGRVDCGPYDALVRPGRRADTAFYVFEGELWGFGLTSPGSTPCA